MADESYDTLVVGGGVHGTSTARELLERGEDVAVADPEGYGSLMDYTEQIGMETMRSGVEDHLEGTDTDDLYEFARRNGREDEIIDGRPSTQLFEDHWDYVVEQYGLNEVLEQGEVESIDREEDRYVADLAGKEVEAENIVLATGKGPLNLPDYAESLPDEGPAYHAFDQDFSMEEVSNYDGETYIVGGGITAGQVYSSLKERGADVNIISRSEIEKADVEADEEWKNTEYVHSELAGLTSRQRYEKVKDERNDGTLPGYIYDELERNHEDIQEGEEIEEIDYNGHGFDLRLSSGDTVEDVQLIFATGFEDAYRDDFYQQISDKLGLETGYSEMPVLEDETLEWLDEDGTGSDIYVTGELAEGYLGPYAGNIAGAQMGSEIIADEIAEYDENRFDEPVEEYEGVEDIEIKDMLDPASNGRSQAGA